MDNNNLSMDNDNDVPTDNNNNLSTEVPMDDNNDKQPHSSTPTPERVQATRSAHTNHPQMTQYHPQWQWPPANHGHLPPTSTNGDHNPQVPTTTIVDKQWPAPYHHWWKSTTTVHKQWWVPQHQQLHMMMHDNKCTLLHHLLPCPFPLSLLSLVKL